ncbi:MAG: 50S ribosomal protein L2 [Patescibacteria group bacterium]
MKHIKPTTAGQRNRLAINYKEYLTVSTPEKSLTSGFRRGSGRNAYGRITARHTGGGVKRRWRAVDFLYDKIGIPGTVVSVEYDPNRTGFIALVVYKDGEKRYILVPAGVSVGREIITGEKVPTESGNRMVLKNIFVGAKVYNVELIRGKGAALVRSAGSSAEIIAQEDAYTTLKLPSGEIRKIHSGNWASLGSVSNPEHQFVRLGKAGRMRHLGVRPRVRGTAMNPVDHPHGGGEGRTLLGLSAPKTPWGKIARGVKTRGKKKKSNIFIIQRRKGTRESK